MVLECLNYDDSSRGYLNTIEIDRHVTRLILVAVLPLEVVVPKHFDLIIVVCFLKTISGTNSVSNTGN
jgi:hypothetical protein